MFSSTLWKVGCENIFALLLESFPQKGQNRPLNSKGMRQKLLTEGANELSYEIREIVKKAEQLKKLGIPISWENIGDPIQKNHKLPQWIKDVIADLVKTDDTYSYCPSKGMLATREFLAAQTNAYGGVQITPEDICF